MGGTKLAVVVAFLVVVLLPFAFRTGASSDQHTSPVAMTTATKSRA